LDVGEREKIGGQRGRIISRGEVRREGLLQGKGEAAYRE